MSKIIIEVMPKPDLLDPQGRAIATVLERNGQNDFTQIRVGKRFELVTEGEVTPEQEQLARKLAEELLSNPVIEDVVSIRVEASGPKMGGAAAEDQ